MISKEELLLFLKEEGIEHKLVEHQAVNSIEEMEKLGLSHDGVLAKNLFLRDTKSKRYLLVILRGNRPIDMIELQNKLGSGKLAFAAQDKLKKALGIENGSITPFGILNAMDGTIDVYIDRDLSEAPAVGFHPNENTSTVFLPLTEMEKIIRAHGNKVQFIDIL